MMNNSSHKWFPIIFIALNINLKIAKAIVVPQPRIERIEDPANRNLIDITTEFTVDHIFRLMHTSSCMNKFVDTFMNQQPSRIVVLLPEVNDAGIARLYLAAIQEHRTTFILSGNVKSDENRKTSLSALVIIRNYQQMKNTTSNLNELCSGECQYAVILTDLFETVDSFLEEANNLVKLLWTKEIANVAILGTVDNTLIAAKSLAFEPKRLRHPSSPAIIDQCHGSHAWNTEIDIFTPMKMNNSIIHIAFFDKEPYITVEEIGNSTYYWGLEVWIIRDIAKKMEFNFTWWIIEWGNDTTVEDEVTEELNSDKIIDLVSGGVLWNPDDDVAFAIPYDIVQVVWLLPKYSNISLQGLITPLSDLVWFAVCGIFLFGILIKYLLFTDVSLLEILALVIGVAWYKQPTRISSRLLFMSWVIFGYILTQFYLASLAGQLMAQKGLQIATMADLVNSGLILGGTKTHQMMFRNAEDLNYEEDSDHTSEAIANKFIVFSNDDYEHALHKLMNGENTSVALAVMLNMSSMGTNFNHNNVYILSEALASFPLAFPVGRGLPYLSQINSILHRLIQSGVVNILGIRAARQSNLVQYSNENDDDDDDNDHLMMADIAPGFILLVIGYLAGGVGLLGEIVIKKLIEYKERKNKKMMMIKKVTRKKMRQVERTGRNLRIPMGHNIGVKPNVKVRYHINTRRGSYKGE